MSKQPQHVNFSELKIIGGIFRSRKIRFPEVEGLRPTPNRIRETLFNWLAPYVQGANCLDMFAGTGALSFEAMSRGASYSLLIDRSTDIVQCLKQNRDKLNVPVDIKLATFPYPFHIVGAHKFNIVFIDPPFHQDYYVQVFEWLTASQCLTNDAIIYIESEKRSNVLGSLSNLQVVKDKVAGNVRYSLVKKI